MKLKQLLLSTLFITSISAFSQHIHLPLSDAIGYSSATSFFNYDNSNVGHYSLGWYAVPGSAEARLSGYGGIKLFTASTPRLSILKSGLIGIGTTKPDQALVVNGSIAFAYGAQSVNGIKLNGYATQYYNGITAQPSKVIHKFTGGINENEIMSLTQGGKVGIGIDPQYTLDVKHVTTSGITQEAFRVSETDGREMLITTNNCTSCHSYLTKAGDFAIVWNDKVGSAHNTAAGLVIAPSKESHSGIRIAANGNVGIGTNLDSNTDNFKLSVSGSIRAKEIKVETGWADYVFEDNYDLMPLGDVEAFIKKEHRLPNVPTTNEVENGNIGLGALTVIQQEKLEEMMLYIIELKNELNELRKEVRR
jgi:hypothetical protein